MRSITSGDRLAQQFAPRAPIVQGRAFLLEAIPPFAVGARANACRFLAASVVCLLIIILAKPFLDSVVNRLSSKNSDKESAETDVWCRSNIRRLGLHVADIRSGCDVGPVRIGITSDAPRDHACCWVRLALRLTDTVCPNTETRRDRPAILTAPA